MLISMRNHSHHEYYYDMSWHGHIHLYCISSTNMILSFVLPIGQSVTKVRRPKYQTSSIHFSMHVSVHDVLLFPMKLRAQSLGSLQQAAVRCDE